MIRKRVLIVEDSLVVRELLRYIVGSDPRLEVAAVVASAEEALEVIDSIAPDVISLDIRLPGMNGLDATVAIMSRRPTPVVVVSAAVQDEELNIAMNALRAGALSVVEKPVGTSHDAYAAMARHLCTQLVIMSEVKVVRQAVRRGLAFTSPQSSAAPDAVPPRMVGLVASTGGPNALVQILTDLKAGFPVPVLMVQHITPIFLDGFVAWLAANTPFRVVVAEDGQLPQAGCAYLAPAERHLEVDGAGRLHVTGGAPVDGHQPSGTVLLRSMAAAFPGRTLGVLLTGMGSDGAQGLLRIRQTGGHTIAESEATAVVYGMPAAAVRIGGVSESLPLPAIGPRVLALVTR
ncbi:MAG: chemotaxis-specific protein-glutamate methyltransferase CheB [Alphaproteobacteria bacterium]|nr:chemotaxis-specific protein-glutamate methyltransferase CheB [Alphaproteobacteria bacterium]